MHTMAVNLAMLALAGVAGALFAWKAEEGITSEPGEF